MLFGVVEGGREGNFETNTDPLFDLLPPPIDFLQIHHPFVKQIHQLNYPTIIHGSPELQKRHPMTLLTFHLIKMEQLLSIVPLKPDKVFGKIFLFFNLRASQFFLILFQALAKVLFEYVCTRFSVHYLLLNFELSVFDSDYLLEYMLYEV